VTGCVNTHHFFLGSKIVKLSFRRGLAAVAAFGTVFAGAAVVTTTPAHAVQTITNYGFSGWAYGTHVGANTVGIRSGETAYSYLGCTRLTGILRERSVAAINAPNDPDLITVGAVDSVSRTYRMVGGRVGMRSTNRVAKVVIGAAEGFNITIKGLDTKADAYATKDGKLHSESSFSSVDISASLPDGPLDPLEELLNQVGAGINDLLEQLVNASGNNIVIPGVGRIALGRTLNKVYSRFATSNATALRITLFGPNGVEDVGPGDDTDVVVGRSFARIARNVRNGVMWGSANAINAKLLGGLGTLGPIAERPLPCEGTHGVVRRSDLAFANPFNTNLLATGAATVKVWGDTLDNGNIRAWTEGSIANVTLGTGDTALTITGIVGRANILLTKNGNVYKSISGSKVASITMGDTTYVIPDPGQTLEIPGVASIKFFVTEKLARQIKVTALRVTLLPDTPGETVVNLGNAKVAVRRV
jgi:hypothetical protein